MRKMYLVECLNFLLKSEEKKILSVSKIREFGGGEGGVYIFVFLDNIIFLVLYLGPDIALIVYSQYAKLIKLDRRQISNSIFH